MCPFFGTHRITLLLRKTSDDPELELTSWPLILQPSIAAATSTLYHSWNLCSRESVDTESRNAWRCSFEYFDSVVTDTSKRRPPMKGSIPLVPIFWKFNFRFMEKYWAICLYSGRSRVHNRELGRPDYGKRGWDGQSNSDSTSREQSATLCWPCKDRWCLWKNHPNSRP